MTLTVLQVIPELDAGGAERTTVEIAEAVTKAGGKALVASRGGRLEPELAAAGGSLIAMPAETKNPLSMALNARKLLKIAESENVDIVHARSRAPAWSALWAARKAQKPFVTTYHGVYSGQSAIKKTYNGVMARGDRVIANSQFIARHVAGVYGLGPEVLRVIPRGVDIAAFHPEAVSPIQVAVVRSGWGLMAYDDRPVFLMPGRLTRWKGQDVAIRAFARVVAAGYECVLVLAGDAQGRDDYRNELADLISDLGLYGKARLPGHCEDMPAAYAASHTVLVPSTRPEAFGRVAAEAQVAGRLVAAADHGGARETVDPEVGGWRVTVDDPIALASVMIEALTQDPETLAKQRRAAHDRARVLYSTQALQEATLAVYRELTTGNA